MNIETMYSGYIFIVVLLQNTLVLPNVAINRRLLAGEILPSADINYHILGVAEQQERNLNSQGKVRAEETNYQRRFGWVRQTGQV